MYTVWIKALLAAAPAALFIAAPAPVVHADGACTALAHDYDGYNACAFKANAYCVGRPAGILPTVPFTCTYSDGGRDDCFVSFEFYGHRAVDSACTYIPPGSESAPPPAAGAEPAPAAESVPSQP